MEFAALSLQAFHKSTITSECKQCGASLSENSVHTNSLR